MSKGIFTGIKITSSSDLTDATIDVSGVRALEKTLGVYSLFGG
ncbi:hypothetical protein Javan290_0045 [Streptococcus phage Javan290]|nr:hypothetical protein [Streptococcus marmotae]QBX26099.1 hypothetical protein Javan290_0045 [Streptococcus phage Javan290]